MNGGGVRQADVTTESHAKVTIQKKTTIIVYD